MAAAVAVIAVAGILFFGQQEVAEDSQANVPQEPTLTVEVQPVELTTLTPTVNLLGRVVSFTDSTLTSIIDAKVIKVHTKVGEYVNKGDVLVEFDTRNLTTRITELNADITRAKAHILEENLRNESDRQELLQEQQLVEIAVESRERMEGLRQRNLIGVEQFETAQVVEEQSKLAVTRRNASIREHDSRVRQLRADLKSLRITLRNARQDLRDSTITAPFSGRISAVHVALGGRVNIGTPVLGMYDHTAVEVQTLIPNRYLPDIRNRSKVSPDSDAFLEVDGYRLPMKVDRLSAKVTPGKGGVDTFFRITETKFYLELHRTVDVYLQLPPVQQAIAVPKSIVDLSGRVNKVVDGRLQSVPVELHGEFSVDEEEFYIAASEGLTEGDLLITTNLSDSIDGTKVEIVSN